MWKKVFQYFLRRFQITQGRSPMNAAEMNQIQSEAVNWINKTGGKTLPGTPKSQKPPFQGFTPRVIEGGKGKAGIEGIADRMEKIKGMADDLEKIKQGPPYGPALSKEEWIAKKKAENKAAIERLKAKKKTVEDFTKEDDWDPSGMASGGIARVGYAGGKLVKGGAWILKSIKKAIKEVDQGIGNYSNLNPMQQEVLKREFKTLIKQLERGGPIPDEMLDTMIADPQFKSVIKKRSTDKDLYELEDVLLDRQAGKQAEQIVDDVFGKDDWEGEAWDRGRDVVDSLTGPKEIKRRKQIEMLKEFDVTGRKKNASGGIAGPLHLYDGGRANYDKGGMSRRGFLKLIGGLSALPVVGKYFKLAKPAAKAVSPAAEVITRGADGIPNYAWDLINVVKAKGTKEIMEGLYKRNPPSKKYTYKGVEVVEDGTGGTSVRKEVEGIGYDEAGEGYEGVSREVGFDIRPQYDEMIDPDSGVSWYDDMSGHRHYETKIPDEYTEATVRPDYEGKMKDMEEFIDDADHLELKKIADESLIKKAEGGRVDLSKGGLAHVLGV